MALTKQDINQIGGLLDKQSKAFEKRFDAIEKRMVTKDDWTCSYDTSHIWEEIKRRY